MIIAVSSAATWRWLAGGEAMIVAEPSHAPLTVASLGGTWTVERIELAAHVDAAAAAVIPAQAARTRVAVHGDTLVVHGREGGGEERFRLELAQQGDSLVGRVANEERAAQVRIRAISSERYVIDVDGKDVTRLLLRRSVQ